MNLEQRIVEKILQDVLATDESEIQCHDADIIIRLCIDSGLSLETAKQQYPELWYHFYYCPNCAEEYVLLMGLAQLEATGQLQQPIVIPLAPDVVQSSSWQQAKDVITRLFPGFSPELAMALRRGASLTAGPIVVEFVNPSFTIIFTASINDENTNQRDLRCAFASLDESLTERFEGISVLLLKDSEEIVVQNKVISESGDLMFLGLLPGPYGMRFTLLQKEYSVLEVVLP